MLKSNEKALIRRAKRCIALQSWLFGFRPCSGQGQFTLPTYLLGPASHCWSSVHLHHLSSPSCSCRPSRYRPSPLVCSPLSSPACRPLFRHPSPITAHLAPPVIASTWMVTVSGILDSPECCQNACCLTSSLDLGALRSLHEPCIPYIPT